MGMYLTGLWGFNKGLKGAGLFCAIETCCLRWGLLVGGTQAQGGLYNLEQPESTPGLELRLPAWPLPSSGSLLGQEEVVGAAQSSRGLGRAGMGCSRCSWLGPAGPGRSG